MSAWASAFFGAGLVAWPEAGWLAGTTFVLGAIAGCLQSQALRASAAGFRVAATAIEVRQALSATRSGKLSIALLWGSSAVAVIWVIAGGFDSPMAGLLCGCSSFALAREMFSIAAIRRLARGPNSTSQRTYVGGR